MASRVDQRSASIEMESQPLNTEVVKIEVAPTNGAKGGTTSPPPMPLGLSKEELLKYANDPLWIKLRHTLFVLFWGLWVAMLAGAALIIFYHPSCSAGSKLRWYHKASCSQIKMDLFDNQLSKVLQNLKPLGNLGFSTLLFPSLIFARDGEGITSFENVDSNLGNLDQFGQVLAKLRIEHGTNALLDLDLTTTSRQHPWFVGFINQDPRYSNHYIQVHHYEHLSSHVMQAGYQILTQVNEMNNRINFVGYKGQPVLKLSNKELLDELFDSLRIWTRKGIKGFRLLNAPYLIPRTDPDPLTTRLIYDISLVRNRELFVELAKRLNMLVSDGALLLQLREDYRHEAIAREFYSNHTERSVDLIENDLLENLDSVPSDLSFLKDKLEHYLRHNPMWNPQEEANGPWTGWVVASENKPQTCFRNALGYLAPHGSPVTYFDTSLMPSASSVGFWQQVEQEQASAQPTTNVHVFKQLQKLRSTMPEEVLLGKVKFPMKHQSVFAMVRHSDKQGVLMLANLDQNAQVITVPSQNYTAQDGEVVAACSSNRQIGSGLTLTDHQIRLEKKEVLVLKYRL